MQAWGAAGFPLCLETRQSPIDIRTAGSADQPMAEHSLYAIDWSQYDTTATAETLEVMDDHDRLIKVDKMSLSLSLSV